MWHATVDPTRRYRLEGCLNESERAGVGLYSFNAGGAAVLAGYTAFDRTTTAADGSFSNRISAPPPLLAEEVRSDPDTNYGLGYFELGEGEWLEVLIPEGLSGYWSLHAYNHWCEALHGAGVHDLSAVPDRDGRIRIRIGPSLAPEIVNRVDTLARRRGVLIFRAIGAAGATQTPQAQLRR